MEDVIAARGSQRRMDATRGLPGDVLRTSMSVSLRGVSVPHWVVVHDVGGIAPGIYRWPGLRTPVRGGALRDELYQVCLDQALARDAAFVAVAAAGVAGLGDREYREAQLAAGLAEGRLHLAAYALGASASGMTFLDSEVPALLGEPADALLFTCVGVPSYASAAAGAPGTPSRVRMVRPDLQVEVPGSWEPMRPGGLFPSGAGLPIRPRTVGLETSPSCIVGLTLDEGRDVIT